MQIWKVAALTSLFALLLAAYLFSYNEWNIEACETRDAIEATTMAFGQTLKELDRVINEGATRLEALYDVEYRDDVLKSINMNKYITDDSGIYHNVYNPSGSTGFATGHIQVTEDLKKDLIATESLDAYFESLLATYPFITQVYYNESRSYSRVYPAFQTKGAVEANQDLTQYNFFNVAFDHGDHAVFIDTPYIDPAGKGWVISLVRPLYIDDELKGVFGVDISIEELSKRLLVSNGMLIVNKKGEVLSLSEDMYQQAGLKVLKKHRYYSEVDKTISLPEEYNLGKSKINGFRSMWSMIADEYKMNGEVDFDGDIRRYCAFKVDAHDIYLIHISSR